MSAATGGPPMDVSRFPSFLDRLEDREALAASEIAAELDPDREVDGVVYHDRGIRVPGYEATFVREPPGSRSTPAFSVQLDAVGPRSCWAVFDASMRWELYLVRSPEMAALAWMNDEEYAAEEAGQFGSKRAAVAAGRFSFGVFLYAGADWEAERALLEGSRAPALVQREDGRSFRPDDQAAFYEFVNATPEQFRATGGGAPAYLGVLELEVSIAD